MQRKNKTEEAAGGGGVGRPVYADNRGKHGVYSVDIQFQRRDNTTACVWVSSRWSLVVIMMKKASSMGCCEVVRTGLDVFYCFVAAVTFIEVFCHRVIHIFCSVLCLFYSVFRASNIKASTGAGESIQTYVPLHLISLLVGVACF